MLLIGWGCTLILVVGRNVLRVDCSLGYRLMVIFVFNARFGWMYLVIFVAG